MVTKQPTVHGYVAGAGAGLWLAALGDGAAASAAPFGEAGLALLPARRVL